MLNESTSEAFFEEKYQRAGDPWDFAGSAYEQARYAAIISCLRGRSFRRAFEPGCSIGILTERLAPLCNELDAIEISATAAARAAARCRHLANVRIRHGALPDALPAGSFDLIVFSEIGYYFHRPELRSLAERLLARLESGGVLLAAHWLGASADHILSGDQVHQALASLPGLELTAAQRSHDFRLDRWVKCWVK